MSESFDFMAAEILGWSAKLTPKFGSLADPPRRTPLGQLVKSVISSRTRDAVSLGAYRRLGRRWPKAAALAEADNAEVEQVIADVTFPEKKAIYLPAALRLIEEDYPDFRLDFLAALPLSEALAWLERLPGVGRKVAAATLNASTLRRRVFIVDSHVHRVLQRIGFIGRRTQSRTASELVTAQTGTLGADDLLELFVQLKRLGQVICRFETPECASCPLADRCRTARETGRGPLLPRTEMS